MVTLFHAAYLAVIRPNSKFPILAQKGRILKGGFRFKPVSALLLDMQDQCNHARARGIGETVGHLRIDVSVRHCRMGLVHSIRKGPESATVANAARRLGFRCAGSAPCRIRQGQMIGSAHLLARLGVSFRLLASASGRTS